MKGELFINTQILEKYARLIVKIGLNIQKHQKLIITTPIECAYFTRLVAHAAYLEGARDVIMDWDDQPTDKIRYMHAPEDIYDEYPEWKKEFYLSHFREGAAYLRIFVCDPNALKDVDPQRITRYTKAEGAALKEFRELRASFKIQWAVAAVPTAGWAKSVFPSLSEDESIKRLWENIASCTRLNCDDPVLAWEEHKNVMIRNTDFLNKSRFRYLKFKNSIGTDLTVELPQKHIWSSIPVITAGGLECIPNMPTEEIFTMPLKTGVNGKAVGVRPMVRDGSMVDHFYMVIKEGKIVDYHAQIGAEVLKGWLETDENACYLGEVALVPYDSAVSNTDLLYYNTLFDENASTHLAFGSSYPVSIENGASMSGEEREKNGVNISLIHEDFMIGTKDMQVTGVTADGIEIVIMKNGNYAF